MAGVSWVETLAHCLTKTDEVREDIMDVGEDNMLEA